ncbi:MAG: type II secretion system protein [Verrucomicrobia bacterium]|nr:type II secretion system protein [Verrucomicrobiota bacterium]
MPLHTHRRRNRPPFQSFTLIELLAVLAIIVLLVGVLLPSLRKDKVVARRITCVSHLKCIGLGFRIFATDQTNLFPMAVSTNFGGAAEYIATPQTFRFFQVLSNELSVPLIVVCPTDTRRAAKEFHRGFSNSNVSYFVGLDADESQPQMLLAGDRNLTSSIPRTNWILELRPGTAAGWTRSMHRFNGNAALADGSVQQFNQARLREQIRVSGDPTNRLSLPD